MVKTFPYLTDGNVDEILRVCAKNDGLLFPPIDEPDFLFAYWRFWPKLIELVKNGEWGDLEREDLRKGPILYVAALICQPGPKSNYSVMRELVAILNRFGVAIHRYKRGEFEFHFKRNTRFDKARFQANG